MLKGGICEISLHRESGQILEAEDSLDFGDCYAGLVAVSGCSALFLATMLTLMDLQDGLHSYFPSISITI